MTTYPFRLVDSREEGPRQDRELLRKRPFVQMDRSFQAESSLFVPGDRLENAINTAIAVGEPLLLTGEPGTGKTQAAYYVAYKLGIELFHFQVKSTCIARDLLYHFDNVEYFREANLLRSGEKLDKKKFRSKGAFWKAIESSDPAVLLLDEIDKAPRDFPNDLLHELDQMEFEVPETGEEVRAARENTPIVVITSNSERRLPAPFLRRCVYHHIEFDDELVKKAVERRRSQFEALSLDFVALALRRFLQLRDRSLRKSPATGELLVWLRVLALNVGTTPETLDQDLSKLPYLGVLLKDHQDLEDLSVAPRKGQTGSLSA